MAKERLSMRKTKEILRLKLVCALTNRQIAASVHVSRPTVSEYLARAQRSGLGDWADIEAINEEELERLLFPASLSPTVSLERPLPDCAQIHKELRNKHVTLMLLWQEYKEQHPQGYSYTQFAYYYGEYKKKLGLVMRQEHKAGEKVFVDYCDGINIIEPDTGEVIPTQLFVAVWGASNYTYVEASRSQDLASWTMSHVRAFEHFGRVPVILVPDNLKSGVTRACRYEPDLNPTYHDLARHYGVAVIPARPMHPRDKAKVEAGVLVAQRWILAALRHRTFLSLAELNLAIRELLKKLNAKPLRKINKSRKEMFDQIDSPFARPLPERAWEYADWLLAKLNIDYHIEADKHFYSAPCRLVGKRLDARLAQGTVEIFYKGERVRSHARSFEKYKYTTHPQDMPESHRRYSEWTPSRIVAWAGKTGPKTAELVGKILETKEHPEQGYRSALGILRLERSCGKERIEAASGRALAFKSYSYKSVKRILAAGAEGFPLGRVQDNPQPLLPFHDNIRGGAYYQSPDKSASAWGQERGTA